MTPYTRNAGGLAFKGLRHLSGESVTVRVVAANSPREYYEARGTVTEQGTLSVSIPTNYRDPLDIRIGRPYTAKLRTLDYGGQEEALKAFTRAPVELTLLGELGSEYRMSTNVSDFKVLPRHDETGHTQGVQARTEYNAEVTVEHAKPETFQVRALVLKTEYDTADLPNQRSA